MTDGGDEGGPLDSATTVLVLAPEVRGPETGPCVGLLDRRTEPVDRAVAVTVTQSASDWLDRWDRSGPSDTAVTCVDVDVKTRSTASAPSPGHDGVPVERVTDPTDLETVGRRVSDVLQRADESDERVGLIVHSLSGVLQYADETAAFKFVYTLGEVVRRVDGTALFHLGREAHGSETIETFRVVCDATVDVDGDVCSDVS